MKRVTPLLLLSASVAVGCAQFQDARIEARQRRMARAAYTTSPGACNGIAHSVDYAQGFEEGYYDVASGGDGCPPALPPKKYWGAAYQTPTGREHIEAWFQGFRDGAAAAKADGVASYGTIYVSAEHRNASHRPDGHAGPGVATPPGALIPHPMTTPTPPSPGVLEIPIIGPSAPSPFAPPNSTQGQKQSPMSDAQKAPPLRDINKNAPPPAPPPSAQRPDWKTPEAPGPKPLIAAPLPKPESTMQTIMPAVAPSSSTDLAPIPAVKQVDAKMPTPTPEPVKLKLPEFELPAGYAPEADLGVPKSVSDR